MGRKASISREALLETAEAIVRRDGATALTIDALAKAAGISKGGVQYSFDTKDALVRALIERWTDQFDELLADDGEASPETLIRRYIDVMRTSQKAMDAKMAGLMIAYIQDPKNLVTTRHWYQAMFQRFSGNKPRDQVMRVAFLAVEGLFFMRIAGIDAAGEWASFLDDVETVLERLLT